MATTIDTVNPLLLPSMGGSTDGMFGGGGAGLIGGLILGSLLRNNGGFLGGNDGAVAGATLRNPPEQNQANMDLMAGIGAVDKAVAVSTAAMEASQAAQSLGIQQQLSQVAAATVAQITGVKDTVTQNAMVLSNQIGAVDKSIMENRYELSKDISNDGEKTRALITQQYEATLNRQLAEANAALIELRSNANMATVQRNIEVNTTNNINQAQAQTQQQQQFQALAGLVANLANDLQYIRATNQAINIGAGTQTANPSNANTNVRA